MKNHKKILVLLFSVVVLGIFLLSGCTMGMTKEQRLSALCDDIEAGANTRSHFQGHTNAGDLSGTEFYATPMYPGNSVDITGTSISGDNFYIYYVCDAPSGTQTASGTFYDAGDGTSTGSDWYIYQITVEGTTFPD